jgi:hypothetical protein
LSEDLKAEAIIGEEAESFFKTQLGETILGLAEQDLKLAAIAFAEADITDPKQVAKVQQDIRVAIGLESYLKELVHRGHEAFQAYKQQQREG